MQLVHCGSLLAATISRVHFLRHFVARYLSNVPSIILYSVEMKIYFLINFFSSTTFNSLSASRVVGGFVLSWGCVQEEIRFVLCPELIVCRLLCENMNDNEAILVKGRHALH